MAAQIVSGLLFVFTFIGILREQVDRTIIAFAGAGAMVVAGTVMGFFDQEEALAAIDFNTLGLLLGLMILVAMLAKTGFFQYLATLTAKRSGGNPIRLLLILGGITTVLSMFLPNVTTIVLIAPVTILITEVLGISPIPYLIAEAILSNIGGVATLVGDPPNIIIGSAAGLSFNDFLVHLAPIVAVAWLGAVILLRLLFQRDLSKPSAGSQVLDHLDEREAIKDPSGLQRILFVLAGVIVLFFLQSVLKIDPALVAVLGASAALLWGQPDVEELLKEVDWSVLLFFAALFVVAGGLEASGLLESLAESITSLAEGNVLLTGIVLIWVTAILSSIVDNIPITIVMIPIILDLGLLGVEIGPLWWALALGAGFGGNGTPIGSMTNIITIKVSEGTRHPITTGLWLRTGLPVMLLACLIGSILYALTFPLM